MAAHGSSIIPVVRIQKCIYVIRGHKILLDRNLAVGCEELKVVKKELLQFHWKTPCFGKEFFCKSSI